MSYVLMQDNFIKSCNSVFISDKYYSCKPELLCADYIFFGIIYKHTFGSVI